MAEVGHSLKNEFKCANCGGSLVWRASKNALVCMQCGTARTLDETPTPLAEIPLAEGLAFLESHAENVTSLQSGLTEYSCSSCGAVSRAEPQIMGSRCPFCQSPQLVPRHSRAQIAPQGVWPFRLEDTDARNVFKTWIASLWFRPSALRKLAQVESLKGVYVPYWTFDAQVFSQFTAERGDNYTVSYTDNQGKTQFRTQTRWTWVSGSRSDFYDDVLVCASAGLPRSISDRFLSFRTADSLPYRAEYLLGWITECYTVPLTSAHDIAEKRIEDSQSSRCAQSVGGDAVRSLSVQNQFASETFKHLLLPIWICSYQYQTRKYSFFVNAQTGEIYGEAPYSWIKISFAVASALVLLVWFFGYTNVGRQLLQQMLHH